MTSNDVSDELPRLPASRSIAEKPPLYSVRRDPQRPETEVAAFGHERELTDFIMASCDRVGTEVLFVLRHDRRRNVYTLSSSYIGRPPPLVIDHEPIDMPDIDATILRA